MSFNYTIGEKLSAIYEREGLDREGHYFPIVSEIVDMSGVKCGLLPETIIIDIDKYFDMFVKFYGERQPEGYISTNVIAVFDCIEGKFINFKEKNILFDKEMVNSAMEETELEKENLADYAESRCPDE